MTVVSDNFNRADSASLGASWTEVIGDWAIVSNQCECNDDGGATGYYARYETDVGSSDMFAEVITNSTQGNASSNAGIAARMRVAANTSYQFTTNLADTHAFWRTVAGVETQIATFTAALVVGDRIRIETVGRTLRAKINDALIALAQDANITDGQRGGLNGYNNVGSDVVRFDDFEAGALTDDLVAAYVADWGAQTNVTNVTLNPTFPAQITAGDLALAHVVTRDETQTVTAPAGQGWQLIQTASQTGLKSYLFAKIWGLGGQTDDDTPTFSIGSGTAGWGIVPSIVRNPKHATNPWTSVNSAIVASDQQSNASSTTVTAPSVSHTGANRTVLYLFNSADDNALITPSTGALVYGGAPYDSTIGNDYAQAAAIVEDVTLSGSTGTATVTESVVGPDVSDGITLVIAVPGASTVNGSGALIGGGTLAATGTRSVSGASVLTGGGSLTAGGTRTTPGTAVVPGGGTLSASGTRSASGAAALSGGGSLTATGTRTVAGAGALIADGSATAIGTRTTAGLANLSGGGALAAVGARSTSGNAALAATGSLAAQGTRTVRATAALAGGGQLSATGTTDALGTGVLAGGGSLVATGLRTVLGAAALPAAASLLAAGTRTVAGSGALVGMAVLTAAGASEGLGTPIEITFVESSGASERESTAITYREASR